MPCADLAPKAKYLFSTAEMRSDRKKGGTSTMSYLETLEKNAAKTKTMNGAAAWSATGDACLDLFAVAGGMRHRAEADLIRLFDRAYI